MQRAMTDLQNEVRALQSDMKGTREEMKVAQLRNKGMQDEIKVLRFQLDVLRNEEGGERNEECTAGAQIYKERKFEHPDGKYRRVPRGWTFPKLGLQKLYVYWHCGDESKGIPPMKRLWTSDVDHIGKRARVALSEIKRVMSLIDNRVKEKGLRIRGSMTMTRAEANSLYARGEGAILELVPAETATGRERNVSTLKVQTVITYINNMEPRIKSNKKQKSNDVGNGSSEPAPTDEVEDDGSEKMGNAGSRSDDAECTAGAEQPYEQFIHPDGKRRRIPHGWKPPTGTVQRAYVYWHCGDLERKVAPIKMLKSRDSSTLDMSDKQNLKAMRRLMGMIDRASAAEGVLPSKDAPMTEAEANACFAKGCHAIKLAGETPTGRPRNARAMTWASFDRLTYNEPNPKGGQLPTIKDE